MTTIVYQKTNTVSVVGAEDLNTSIMYCPEPSVSTIGAYPHSISLLSATQRFVTILKLELPASMGIDHVLLTLSGDYLITLSGEYLAYV